MFLAYEESDGLGRSSGPFVASKYDATERYLHHFRNKLFLGFMLANGTLREKNAASKELETCDRKLAFWARQPGFSKEKMARGCEQLKKEWK